jgi:hypothetical protein
MLPLTEIIRDSEKLFFGPVPFKCPEVKSLKPVYALLFAFAGVLMLTGVGLSLSLRSLPLALLFLVGFIVITGLGFVVKARQRRKGG